MLHWKNKSYKAKILKAPTYLYKSCVVVGIGQDHVCLQVCDNLEFSIWKRKIKLYLQVENKVGSYT